MLGGGRGGYPYVLCFRCVHDTHSAGVGGGGLLILRRALNIIEDFSDGIHC